MNYFENKTGQSKTFFGGPLITVDNEKMSKTSKTFQIKDLDNISKTFINIVNIIEKIKLENTNDNIKLDYLDLVS